MLAPEEGLRARVYELLARVLIEPPSADALAALSAVAADASPLGQAFQNLALAARHGSAPKIAEEFDRLFIGLTEGELRPYGSFYRVGFLYERPLAELRRDLARLGIRRSADVREPEDHIALLCETMAALIVGRFGEPADLPEQYRFFTAHLGSWAPRFFADLEAADSAEFYRAVARLGAVFMAIEAEAFALAEQERTGSTGRTGSSDARPLASAGGSGEATAQNVREAPCDA